MFVIPQEFWIIAGTFAAMVKTTSAEARRPTRQPAVRCTVSLYPIRPSPRRLAMVSGYPAPDASLLPLRDYVTCTPYGQLEPSNLPSRGRRIPTLCFLFPPALESWALTSSVCLPVGFVTQGSPAPPTGLPSPTLSSATRIY